VSSTGRTGSRFRPGNDVEVIPTVAGLCGKCLREMWAALPDSDRSGRLEVATDLRHCKPCYRYITTTGRDPRYKTGAAAERLPVELAEDDDSWRADPARMLCSSIGAVDVFEPDPMSDEDDGRTKWERTEFLESRRLTATRICARCPAMWDCRNAARERGYEGLWGGWFFTRVSWTDLDTGAMGPTRYTSAPERRRLLAGLTRNGFDQDGEPLADEGAAVA
jgi:hypothetical protein